MFDHWIDFLKNRSAPSHWLNSVAWPVGPVLIPDWYRKIPKKSSGAYIFQRHFLRGLSTEGHLRFKIDWASHIVGSKITVFALFYFLFEDNFPRTSPWGGLSLEGRFNGGFFALPDRGASIWRGLYSEVYGILGLHCDAMKNKNANHSIQKV